MPAAPLAAPSLTRICLRNLLRLRLGYLAGTAAAYAWEVLVLGLRLPVAPLLILWAGLLAYTLWRQRQEGEPGQRALLRESVIDLAGLTFALYLTGGAHNPLIILLLLPITVAAATLHKRLIWAITGTAVACYTGLMLVHRDFPALHHHQDAFDLHVLGMWGAFLLSGVLIAVFVGNLAVAVRARDRQRAQEDALLASARTGIFVVQDGRLVFVNPRLAELLEYPTDALLGRDPLDFLAEEDRPTVALIAERRGAGAEAPEAYECRVLTRSGRERWVSMHNTLTTFGERPATLGTVQDISEHKRMESELRELPGRLLRVQEQERRRVARDLHDGICQMLTATRLAVESHLMASPSTERRASMHKLRESVAVLRQAEEEVRRISTDLRPAMLDDLGLLATLRWHLGELGTRHPGLRVRHHLEVAEAAIPDGLKTTIYRIVQEAASNAVRHSGGSALDVHLRVEGGELCLRIEDNGVGFLPGQPSPRALGTGHYGLGLGSMRERAEQTGGELRVRTRPGQGTRVEASWCPEAVPLSG